MFTITDEMKKRCEENKSWLESKFIDDMRTYWIAFCDKFWRECKWNFDTRWNFDCETYLCYVWDVCGMTVIIGWDIRWNTVEEFLDIMEELENKIINLNEKFWKYKENKENKEKD